MNSLRTVFLFLIVSNNVFADCDPTLYPGCCDIKFHSKPSATASSLVYCGNIVGYISPHQFDLLARYQRANMNMVLKVNGMYIDSPCIPAQR